MDTEYLPLPKGLSERPSSETLDPRTKVCGIDGLRDPYLY